MTDFSISTGKWLGAYALALGLACLTAGLMEISGGYGEMIPGDVFGGLVLVVIAATYLNGVKGVCEGGHGGLSFLMGGVFLTMVFGGLYLLIIGADALIYLMGEAEEMPALVDLRPAIWIAILSLPLAYMVRKLTGNFSW